MAKDPAFLFYPNDYIGGTLGMTLEEKGAYMELLILQFNKGHFTIEQAQKLLNGSFEKLWPVVKEKFEEDETRGFFNERLEIEKDKRKNFNTKQKERGSKGGRPKNNPDETRIKPAGYQNKSLLENENENKNKDDLLGKSENPFPFPKPEDVKDLPKAKIISTIEILKITAQVDLKEPDVLIMWEAFKQQNLTGKKYYVDEEAVQSHFMNWIKKTDFKKIKDYGNSKTSSANHGKSSGAYELAKQLREEFGIDG
jgi:uncharacterized protein YdaU (DUF1376 family)